VKESEESKGWIVEFRKPDGKVWQTFVSYRKGAAESKSSFIAGDRDNCACVELNESTGYIRIKQFSWVHRQEDHQEIRRFIANAKGGYDTLIIDLRHNLGGSPNYFYENLIEPLVKETVTFSHVTGLKRRWLSDKSPEFIERHRLRNSLDVYEIAVEEVEPPTEYDGKDWIFYEVTHEIEPKDPYDFNGDIYVLIDHRSFSAADNYANAVKRIGYAKLAGVNTAGGTAGYVAPSMITLPNSGMKFRVETDLVINPDGSINEIVGTPPDIRLLPTSLPAGLTREALLEDTWIQKIIYNL
jgi:C-terminal processing protease CtpA/Prc